MPKDDKKGVGRPETNINWAVLDKLLMAGCSGAEIAGYFGCSQDTIYGRVKEKYNCNFSEYKRQKQAGGNAFLRLAQFKNATENENTPMQIFLGKNRLGQTDKQQIEVDQRKPDFSKLSEEQLLQLQRLYKIMEEGQPDQPDQEPPK